MKRSPPATVRLEATIAELVASGDGVAICEVSGERRAVFVPGVIPGERVAAVVDFSRRPARGRLVEVLDPSPARVAPPCAHVERCGGCDWMHLSVDAAAREHGAIIARILPPAFERESVHVELAPSPLGYRTRARVHVEARAPKGRGDRETAPIVVGMYGRQTHDPAPVDRCVVLAPAIETARAALPSLLAGARGKGEAQLALGAPETPRKAVLDLRWQGELPSPVWGRLEAAVKSGTIGGARVFEGQVKIPATIGDPTPWLTGADGAPLRLGPGGFSQASEAGNTRLAQRVAELAAQLSPDRNGSVVELYAGAGNLTVLLARSHAVLAVESDRDACAAARINLAARGLSARVVEGDAASYAIPPATKLVVLDPPRAGAKEVARALAARPVPAILYVSCDPPTLGRDLATLADAGYELRSIEAFEMFPQTSHVETVAALVRGPRGKGGRAR